MRITYLAAIPTFIVAIFTATPAFAAPSAPWNFIINPNTGTYINKNTPTFTWNSPQTTTAPVNQYEIKFDTGSYLRIGNTLTYTSNALGNGSHVATLRAVDTQDTAGPETATYFTVDTQFPYVPAMTPSTATVNSNFILAVAPTDNTGVASCSYSVNGISQGNMTADTNNGTFYVTKSFAGIGNYSVSATCIDKAGNSMAGPVTNITSSAAPSIGRDDTTPTTAAPNYTVQPTPDTSVNSYTSTAATSKSQVLANSTDSAVITATIRNAAGVPLINKYVTLQTSRPSVDTIIYNSPVTDSLGRATFTVHSTTAGASSYTPVAENVSINYPTSVTYYVNMLPTYSDTTANTTASYILSSKSQAAAGTGEISVITVVVRNASSNPIPNKYVTLQSSRPEVDTVIAQQSTTNDLGQAIFYVRSTASGTSVYSPIVDGSYLYNNASVYYTGVGAYVQPQGPILSGVVASGTLVKLPCYAGAGVNDACHAVYFVGSDAKRHAFPNARVYYSWYANFANVQTVDPNVMINLPIGKNVTYRPGVKLVKFITSNIVYAVSRGSVLRPVQSEALAAYMYGSEWKHTVDDISDAFIGDYLFGVTIDSIYSFNPNTEMQNVPNILANVL